MTIKKCAAERMQPERKPAPAFHQPPFLPDAERLSALLSRNEPYAQVSRRRSSSSGMLLAMAIHKDRYHLQAYNNLEPTYESDEAFGT